MDAVISILTCLITTLETTRIATVGMKKKDIEHFIFRCPNYAQARLTFFHNTRLYHPISTNKLLYGLQGASEHSNKQLINRFHTYINATQRFNQNQSQ